MDSSLTIATTGQILVHGPVDASGDKAAFVRTMLSSADVAIANLEATVATPGAWPTKTKTLHLASPEALNSVRALGFRAVAHANNHAFDLGPPGIARTRQAAQEAGLAITGSGATRADALRPALVHTTKGIVALLSFDLGPQPDLVYAGAERGGIAPLRITRSIGLPADDLAHMRRIAAALGDDRRLGARRAVGYSEGGGFEFLGTPMHASEKIEPVMAPRCDDLAAALDAIAMARKQSRAVVVALHSHHWDADWSQTPDWCISLAGQLIDAGADMITGTGAPVLQGIRFHRNRPIFGGLGNFIFHTDRAATYDRERPGVWAGAICRAHFSFGGDCEKVEILPVEVGRPESGSGGLPCAPVPAEGTAALAILEQMTRGLDAADLRRVVQVNGEAASL